MKALISTLIIIVFSFQLNAETINPGSEGPEKLKWDKITINLGEIEKNKAQAAEFIFKNTGDEPILITNVRASCGCTTSKYTKEPIKPGRKGEIVVTYNAKKIGPFHKTVRVSIQGIDEPVVLRVKGTVVENK